MLFRMSPDLMISAARRVAEQNGASLFLRHRGDSDNGGLLIKINLLNGSALLMQRVTIDDSLKWQAVLGDDPVDEGKAEDRIEQFLRYDPDLWVIEIEDPQGRLWLDEIAI